VHTVDEGSTDAYKPVFGSPMPTAVASSTCSSGTLISVTGVGGAGDREAGSVSFGIGLDAIKACCAAAGQQPMPKPSNMAAANFMTHPKRAKQNCVHYV
jgi:hypothetical protein